MIGAGDEPVALGQVELERVTAKAILVTTGKQREVWIPMAAVHEDSEIYGLGSDGDRQQVGAKGALILKRWFVEQKGWPQ